MSWTWFTLWMALRKKVEPNWCLFGKRLLFAKRVHFFLKKRCLFCGQKSVPLAPLFFWVGHFPQNPEWWWVYWNTMLDQIRLWADIDRNCDTFFVAWSLVLWHMYYRFISCNIYAVNIMYWACEPMMTMTVFDSGQCSVFRCFCQYVMCIIPVSVLSKANHNSTTTTVFLYGGLLNMFWKFLY